MAAFSVFDKLVAGLSSVERRDMLQRIASSVKVIEPDEALAEERAIDLDESFRSMGLIRRLVIILVAFFTGRERLSVVEGYLLRELARTVNARLPHGLDTVQLQLRPGAADDIRRLADDARRFSATLGRVMGRERRGFVAFLAGLHAPEAHARLVADADPFAIGAAQPELRDADVRRRALNEVDEAVGTLSPRLRQRIYTDIRGAHHLMTLSSFPFDRILAVFRPVAGGDAVPVPLARVSDELAKLAVIFEGLKQDPSAVLFEAFGLYEGQDRLDDDDAAVERVVQENVDAFSEAYAHIREFARNYPLVDLVRLAHSNIHYRPTVPGGGEDWFAQWKGFWRDRIEQSFRRYAYDRRIDSILARAREILELVSVGPFPGYPPSGLDQPARHALSVGLLHAITTTVFDSRIVGPVGTIHHEGEFYKADNRTDMDRGWLALQRVKTDTANLEVRLRPTGDLGMAWSQAQTAAVSEESGEERRLSLIASIDGDSQALVRRAVDTFRLLGDILQGVLFGTVGGRYDTIGNLGELGGRNADGFIKRVESAHVACKSAAELLTDLLGVESNLDAART